MDRAQTFARLARIPSVFLNLMQDVGVAARAADQGDLSAMNPGFEARLWQCEANIATGALKTVCTSALDVVDEVADPVVLTAGTIDWADREVFGIYRTFSSPDQHPGQASDHTFDGTTGVTLFWGYLGKGALNAGGTAVAPGSPPSPASGTSWAVRVTTDVWLYLDTSDGSLRFYNDTGSTLYRPTIVFFATGKTGKRP